MASLPTPGGDDGTWGPILNDFLEVSLNSDGTLNAAEVSAAIEPSGVTPATYGDSTHVAQVTVDAQGFVTDVTDVSISGSIGGVTSVFTRTGAVTATSGDYSVGQITGAAALASPALTGTPTAPTATGGTNTTQIATTAFVTGAVATTVPTVALTGDVTSPGSGSAVTTLADTVNVEAVSRIGTWQDARRRGGSVEANLLDGVTHYVFATNITASSTTITVTSTLNPPFGSQVTIAGALGLTNVNGTWTVTGLTSTTFTAVVTNAPSGTYTASSATVSYITPIIDVIIGDSIPFGEGSGPNGITVGYTDNQTVLKAMENRASGLPDPQRGFRRCHQPFFASDTWNNLAVGTQVTASGPCANYDTSWQLTTTGQVIGDTHPFRRAVVLFKRRTNGDDIQVSFNGGSTFTSTISTAGTGYFMVDSGDLGYSISRTLQVEQVSGGGGAGVEVAGYRLYQTEGLTGAYSDVLATPGTTAVEWVANTDWDTYWLPMVQPRRVLFCVGVNDLATGGQTVSQLTTNLTTLITRAQAAAPLAEIVLVAEYHPGNVVNSYNTGITGANWQAQFVAPLALVAFTHGCTFIDLFARIGDVSVIPGDSGDPYGLTQTDGILGAVGDGVHLGDNTQSTSGRDGQRALAEAYWEKLSFVHPMVSTPAPGWTQGIFPWTYYTSGGGVIFLMPNQYATKFGPGTKLRWAESGVVKYGVVSSAIANTPTAGTTAVSLTPTPDYVIAANPDTGSNWYSYENPPDFPSSFTWNPAITGATGGTVVGFWSINGGICQITQYYVAAGTGTATTYTATAPLDAGTIAIAMGTATDNGSPFALAAIILGATSTITLYQNGTGASSWTASGPRAANFTMSFPISPQIA